MSYTLEKRFGEDASSRLYLKDNLIWGELAVQLPHEPGAQILS